MNYFEKCQYCKPPTRYPGCQDHCEHYAEAKARYDADKAKAMGCPSLKYYANEHKAANLDSIAKYTRRRPKRYKSC